MNDYEPEYHDWQPATLADRVMTFSVIGMCVIIACCIIASAGRKTPQQSGNVVVEIETVKQ